jgi:retinol-binding protein 3
MNTKPILLLLAVLASPTFGDQNSSNAARNHEVIDAVLKRIGTGYIYSEKLPEIARSIQGREAHDDYSNLNDAAFAEALTRDLQSAAGDLHFQIEYSPSTIPIESGEAPAPSRDERFNAGRENNFGFDKAEVLQGNIGYINVRTFHRAEAIGDVLAAAMDFVSNTDALIVDVRGHDGGRADAVALMVSYFVEGNPKQLTGIYWKQLGTTVESFTSPSVKGKKYLDRPVYILTSRDTASAGEGFCDDMKTLKLATLVGERTMGAANPGSTVRLTDHFSMFLPTGKAVNPITGGNWEGTGVLPEVVVPAAEALQRAQLLALKRLIEQSKAEKRKRLQAVVDKLEKSNKTPSVAPSAPI